MSVCQLLYRLPSHASGGASSGSEGGEVKKVELTLKEGSPLLPQIHRYLNGVYGLFYCHPIQYVIKYSDGEDTCLISSEHEVCEALLVSRSIGEPLKLHVHVAPRSSAATSQQPVDTTAHATSATQQLGGEYDDGVSESDSECELVSSDGESSSDEFVKLDEHGNEQVKVNKTKVVHKPSVSAALKSLSLESECKQSVAVADPVKSEVVDGAPAASAPVTQVAQVSTENVAAHETSNVCVSQDSTAVPTSPCTQVAVIVPADTWLTTLPPRALTVRPPCHLAVRPPAHLSCKPPAHVAVSSDKRLSPLPDRRIAVSPPATLACLPDRHIVPALPTEPSTVQIEDVSDDEKQGQSIAPHQVVHWYVTCDGCNSYPIRGIRWKCQECADYDLCQACFDTGVHDRQHHFNPVYVSLYSAPGQTAGRCPHLNRVRAETAPVAVAVEPTPTAGSSQPIVHTTVACDGCGTYPIVGNRYKCCQCNNYDLCQRCEERGDKHPHSHVMLKIRQPMGYDEVERLLRQSRSSVMRPSRCPYIRRQQEAQFAINPPKAEVVCDSSLEKGSKVVAGSTFTKVWTLKNVGDEAWPENTQLVFTGGEVELKDQVANQAGDGHVAIVPRCEPGAVVHVSIDIVAPAEPQLARAAFRLQAPRPNGGFVKFGPKVWLEMQVVAAEEEEEEEAQPEVQEGVDEQKQEESSNVPAPPESTEVPVTVSPAPASPFIPLYPVAHPVNFPVAQPVNRALASPPPVAEPVGDASTSVPVVHVRPFQYRNELATLLAMGFTHDVAALQYLLLNNGGNLEAVVNHLLNPPAPSSQ